MWLDLDFYRKGGCLLDVVEETIVRWNNIEISTVPFINWDYESGITFYTFKDRNIIRFTVSYQ